MKKISIKWLVLTLVLFLFNIPNAFAGGAVVITEPATGTTVSSPVKVCMDVHGLEVQPAKKGINPGKGHHHLLIDVDLPADLSKRIGKDANRVHMGDGSKCKALNLRGGKHVIRTLFANGAHVPPSPVVTSKVITVN